MPPRKRARIKIGELAIFKWSEKMHSLKNTMRFVVVRLLKYRCLQASAQCELKSVVIEQ